MRKQKNAISWLFITYIAKSETFNEETAKRETKL